MQSSARTKHINAVSVCELVKSTSADSAIGLVDLERSKTLMGCCPQLELFQPDYEAMQNLYSG